MGLTVVLSLSLGSVGLARANHVEYDTAEQCMSSAYFQAGLPSCTRVDGGKWRASHGGGGPADPGSIFATFLVIWLFLVAGSVWWVVSTARRHGDPVGTALFGALVGGPLFVLMYGSNSDLIRRSRKLYRWTDRLPDDPSSSPEPEPEPDKASRLRELVQLRDGGLITEDEYASRRRSIIDEI